MGKIHNQRGFTLLEMLISSAIFATVLIAIYTMHITNQDTSTRGVNKIEVQQNARVAKERMLREIRMAGYDPSGAISAQATPAAVQVATGNTITFIADVSGDGISDRVTYRLQGNQLIRETASWFGATWTPNPPATSELAEDVITLSFSYYDGNNNVTTALANIRRIAMVITTQETVGGMTQTFPLTMDMRLRNL